jgi:hypothetical protein
VIITTSRFARTSAITGGGLANFGFDESALSGTVVITNSTFANNSADEGGGLLNGGTLLLTNTTIARNTAVFGGGLSGSGSVVLVNTILALNRSGFPSPSPDCLGPVTSLGTNLIGDPGRCTITLLASDRTGDPGLGDFTDDGTPGHGHFPLLKDSPAIDAGNDAVCPRRDQLGAPRVGPCDIGASEFQGKHHKQD